MKGNIFKRYKTNQILLLCCMLCTLLTCGPLPTDPEKNPERAHIQITKINQGDFVEPVVVTASKNIEMQLTLENSSFVEAVVFRMETSSGTVDSVFTVLAPWESDTFPVSFAFSHAGVNRLIVTTERKRASVIRDTVLFEVLPEQAPICTIWTVDTFKVVVPDNENLLTFRIDSLLIDAASVNTFSYSALSPMADSLVKFNGASLMITVPTDTGTFMLPLGAEKDGCMDTSMFLLTCHKKDTVTTVDTAKITVIKLVDDVAEVYAQGSVGILPFTNDSFAVVKANEPVVTGADLGEVAVHGDTITYTATTDRAGSDTLHYTVTGSDRTASVIITILPRWFKVKNDTASVVVNGSRVIDVLYNDSTAAGSIRISSVKQGSQGSASVEDQKIRYTADSGKTGFDTLVYYVNNGNDSGVVFLSLLAVTIVTHPDSCLISEDTGTVLVHVLGNDSISSGAIVLSSVTPGRFGLTGIVNNTISYTPYADKNGRDSIRYTVNNAADGWLIVTLQPVNDAPVAHDTTLIIPEDSVMSIKLNGTDADGDMLRFIIGQDLHGAITSDSSALLLYKPAVEYNGLDSLTYRVYDGELYSPPAKVKVTIFARNDAPVVSVNSGLTVNEGAAATISASRFACTDPDNAATDLAITATVLPVNGRLEKSGAAVMQNETFPLSEFMAGAFSYTHNGSETVRDSLLVSVSDGIASTNAVVKITISPMNDLPVFSKTGIQMRNSGGVGNCYRDTVMLSDAENNLGNIVISTEPAAMHHSLTISNGRMVLDWNIDNRTYDVGQIVPVSVTVQDGAATVKLEWSVTVGKHVWTKVAEKDSSTGRFIALDSFNIIHYRARGSFGDYAVFESKDLIGGSLWSFMFSWGVSPGCNIDLSLSGNRFGATNNYHSITCDFTDTKSADVYHVPDLFTLENTGAASYVVKDSTSDDYLFHHELGSAGRYFSKVNSDSSTNDIRNICVADGVTFIRVVVFTKNGDVKENKLIRWSNPWWDASYVFEETMMLPSDAGTTICTDNNNADTLYILGNNILLRFPNARSPVAASAQTIERISGVESKSIERLVMLDGSTGFLLGEDGKLYYSKDGFVTFVEESTEKDVFMEFVSVSADKKTVFASGRDFAYKWFFYRY